MDCNRDEAARAKGIAEKKFLQQDYAGARKFALKARQLFPDLEGLVSFVAVAEVHAIALEKLPCGEMNWYAILQADPSADEAFLRKQYRKLALVLHPDKNKSMGADAAFKYISEAWFILSDKTKKAAYDSKIKPRTAPKSRKSQPQCPPAKQSDIPPPTATRPQPPRQPSPPHIVLTFWTACPDCKLQYEYHTRYKDKQLCCPICYKNFLARELSVVIDGAVIWPLTEQKPVKAESKGAAYNVNGYPKGSNSDLGNGSVPVSHSKDSQGASGTRKGSNECGVPGICKEEIPGKVSIQHTNKVGVEAEVGDPLVAKNNTAFEQQVSHGKPLQPECKAPATAAGERSISSEGCNIPNNAGDGECMLRVELDFSPSKKPRFDCKGSTKEWKENTGLCEPLSTKESAGCCSSIHDIEMEEVTPTQGAFDVVDTDLYSFDKDRAEHLFEAGQVWACYNDDEEGFPRYYACISKVVRQPFKIQYIWLEARSSSEELAAWMDVGFSYTCGEFKLGKVLTGTSLNVFSHRVEFEKMQRGGFRIYPTKGGTWALYKDWTMMKSKGGNVSYEVFEVLSDYSDNEGVLVCLLAKVEGFKSLYQQQFGGEQWILPHEMRRFSHSIPVHRLVAGDVPQEWLEGFLLLDPASVPNK